MSTVINTVDCATDRKNVGFGSCFFDPKLIKGFIEVPSTFKIAGDDIATVAAVLAFLVAQAKADTKSQRIFPVHRLKNPTSNNEGKTVQTFTDGSKAVVREGLNDWSWQITNGGLCLHSSLRTHNQNGGYFLLYDADYTLIGWQKETGEIWGIPADFLWAEPWDMNTGSEVTKYMLNAVFHPQYVNEGVGYIKLNSRLLGIEGLQDVVLREVSFDDTTGVAEVTALLECGSQNFAALYGTEMSNAARWSLVNAETGEAVTISAVAVVGAGTNKRFQLTINTADEDYPADGIMLLSFAAPSVLAAAGVEGYESNELELTTSSSS